VINAESRAEVKEFYTASGMSEDDETMVCCFDLKKLRNDWRIWVLVITVNSKLKIKNVKLPQASATNA